MDIASLPGEFHFLRPLWLLGLVPAAALVLALWRMNAALSAWHRAIDRSLLPYLLDRARSASQRVPLLLLLLVWTLAALAMAGPVWEKLPQPVRKREDALVIAMDLSLSMFATDHSPSRLDLAKRKLRDILSLRDEGQTALVVYAGDAHTVTPLTDDVVTIAALVPSLSPNIMPLFGSDPVAAVDMAIGLLDDAEAGRGRILLMTDGISGFDEERAIADRMREAGYELLVMGVGTARGAPIRTSDGSFLTDDAGNVVTPGLNRDVLRSLANRSGGRYHDIQLADSDLAFLLGGFDLMDSPELSEAEGEFDAWREAGPWLVLLALPLASLAFRRGWLFAAALLLAGGGGTRQAQAADWRDLWQRKDQQAMEAYESEEYARAAGLFRSGQWSGAARYRDGDYEAAAAAFSADDGPDGHYNRGNALALLGNYVEAVAAYDEALEADGGHEDAIRNREIVERLLERQRPEESDRRQGEGEDNQSEQDSDSSERSEQGEDGERRDQESEEGDEERRERGDRPPEEREDDSESDSEPDAPSGSNDEEFEERQALEQWLRRIEDDPGELLRRKFRYQYRQRQLNGTAGGARSGGRIW